MTNDCSGCKKLEEARAAYAELRNDMDGTVYALFSVWDKIKEIKGPAWELIASSLMQWNDYLDGILHEETLSPLPESEKPAPDDEGRKRP